MTLRLILTRHAKSSWSDPTLDDFDRPLNGRGRKSCAAIGDWLAEQGLIPGEVILSGARRTVDTWTGISNRLPQGAAMRSDPALYNAGAPTILAVLRSASAATTMLIGHNPGIAEFADRIVKGKVDHPRFADYPTGATAIIRFDAATWSGIDWEQGDLDAFVVPRDLIQ